MYNKNKAMILSTIMTAVITTLVIVLISFISGSDKVELEKPKKEKQETLKKEVKKIKKRTIKKQRQKLIKLKIITEPKNAKIRILNIKPKYKENIKLKPGKYKIEISKNGYITKKEWFEINENNNKLKIKLKKEKEIDINELFK